MNYIYFSPHFPSYQWKFCDRLKQRGVTVLGIGEASYDSLTWEQKTSMHEYYRVGNMGNYDEVMRAVGFFTHKYGKIDRFDSHNEHWLVPEAQIRTDFNIPGTKMNTIMDFKLKSLMKKYFQDAGIGTPRWHLVSTIEAARKFTAEVGYPVVVKPDCGVGANMTHAVGNDTDLVNFFQYKPEEVQFIMEEYADGDTFTFEGIVNAEGQIQFAAGHAYSEPIMEVVNTDEHMSFFSLIKLNPEVEKAGRSVVKSYDLREKFFHFEFIRLSGKKNPKDKGRLVGLEVNMRPPGGMMTEVMCASHDDDIYRYWAEAVTAGKVENLPKPKYVAAFVSRRYRKGYWHSHDEIMQKYGANVFYHGAVDPVFSQSMGNYCYVVRAPSHDETKAIVDFIHKYD